MLVELSVVGCQLSVLAAIADVSDQSLSALDLLPVGISPRLCASAAIPHSSSLSFHAV